MLFRALLRHTSIPAFVIAGAFLFVPLAVHAGPVCQLPVIGDATQSFDCYVPEENNGKEVVGVDVGSLTIPSDVTMHMETDTELVVEADKQLNVNGYLLTPKSEDSVARRQYHFVCEAANAGNIHALDHPYILYSQQTEGKGAYNQLWVATMDEEGICLDQEKIHDGPAGFDIAHADIHSTGSGWGVVYVDSNDRLQLGHEDLAVEDVSHISADGPLFLSGGGSSHVYEKEGNWYYEAYITFSRGDSLNLVSSDGKVEPVYSQDGRRTVPEIEGVGTIFSKGVDYLDRDSSGNGWAVASNAGNEQLYGGLWSEVDRFGVLNEVHAKHPHVGHGRNDYRVMTYNDADTGALMAEYFTNDGFGGGPGADVLADGLGSQNVYNDVWWENNDTTNTYTVSFRGDSVWTKGRADNLGPEMFAGYYNPNRRTVHFLVNSTEDSWQREWTVDTVNRCMEDPGYTELDAAREGDAGRNMMMSYFDGEYMRMEVISIQ